ncbi:MAG: EamA family transporter RarD [Verrucomicrobia bacterium]|nr:EamA family transporter RarD [Verrucomicrobiota bacterium]
MSTEAARGAAGRGAFAAGLCYFIWGLVPLYWRQLAAINPVELIAHRHVWSLLFLLGVIALRADGGLAAVRAALGTWRSAGLNFLSAVLLTANWLVYVWGVNTGHVLECSLGYFLVPLVNVALGKLVLHEHLRPAQWAAIACAAVGVLLQIIGLGHLPFIALALAGTFGFYGLLKKKSALGPLTGLTVETALLAPLALGFLLWQHHTGAGALGRVDVRSHVLVLSAGVITSIPLLLFAYGARRVRLATLGLLQYIAPTVQFALAVAVYHEPFSPERATAFAFIWGGLALYTADSLWAQRPRSA